MEDEIKASLLRMIRERGELPAFTRLMLATLSDEDGVRNFDAIVARLAATHPDLAQQLSWTLGNIESVRMRAA